MKVVKHLCSLRFLLLKYVQDCLCVLCATPRPAVFTATGLFTEVRDNLDLTGKHRFTTGRRI